MKLLKYILLILLLTPMTFMAASAQTSSSSSDEENKARAEEILMDESYFTESASMTLNNPSYNLEDLKQKSVKDLAKTINRFRRVNGKREFDWTRWFPQIKTITYTKGKYAYAVSYITEEKVMAFNPSANIPGFSAPENNDVAQNTQPAAEPENTVVNFDTTPAQEVTESTESREIPQQQPTQPISSLPSSFANLPAGVSINVDEGAYELIEIFSPQPDLSLPDAATKIIDYIQQNIISSFEPVENIANVPDKAVMLAIDDNLSVTNIIAPFSNGEYYDLRSGKMFPLYELAKLNLMYFK